MFLGECGIGLLIFSFASVQTLTQRLVAPESETIDVQMSCRKLHFNFSILFIVVITSSSYISVDNTIITTNSSNTNSFIALLDY